MHIYGNPLLRNAEVTCLVIFSGACLFVVLASQQCCMGWPNKSDKEVMPQHTGLKRFQRVSNCQSFSAPWSERDEPNHFTWFEQHPRLHSFIRSLNGPSDLDSVVTVMSILFDIILASIEFPRLFLTQQALCMYIWVYKICRYFLCFLPSFAF